MRGTTLSILALVSLTACATPDRKPVAGSSQKASPLMGHVFATNGDGDAYARNNDLPDIKQDFSTNQECVSSQHKDNDIIARLFSCIVNTAAKQHAEWISDGFINGNEPLHLLFYFNGGLNTAADAGETALGTVEAIQREHLFPIYMIWPTGALDTYKEDVTRVRNGRQIKPEDGALWPSLVVGDLLRGLGDTPVSANNSVEEFWGRKTSPERYSLAYDEAKYREYGSGILSSEIRVAASVNVDQMTKGDSTATTSVGDTLYYNAMTPVRAATLPLTAGFGQTMWENMVRRSRTTVHAVSEFATDEQSEDAEAERKREETLKADLATFPHGSGGFGRFFQWLTNCRQDLSSPTSGCPADVREGTRRLLANADISLIGHSMGAIVINELLVAYPDLPYRNIVFLAGAASVRETARAVAPILRARGGETRFYSLSLHPANEASEPTAGGVLLSGSLLVLVDELFEHPKTIGDRTVGQWRNMRAAYQLFPPDVRNRITVRVFDRLPEPADSGIWSPTPLRHQDFNDATMPFWCPTFWGAPAAASAATMSATSPAPQDQIGRCAELVPAESLPFERIQPAVTGAPST
ncbi:MAG: hypothetical protein U1E14_02145 [Geminicoccaceae bacterium]